LSFHEEGGLTSTIDGGPLRRTYVTADWMRCSNEECEEVIVRVHQDISIPGVERERATWIARPRFATSRRVDPRVPEPFRTDFMEAAALLDTSPRMSAVLSRRILGDLLRKYAKKDEPNLVAQIDAFTAESGHPSALTDNLHHFREVGNFGAHTQEVQAAESGEPVIIDVSREEAEWTLDLVERLFDYFIVQPAKDEEFRARMDEKIERAGRKPLRPSASKEEEQQ
jgi:hypothetical protein